MSLYRWMSALVLVLGSLVAYAAGGATVKIGDTTLVAGKTTDIKFAWSRTVFVFVTPPEGIDFAKFGVDDKLLFEVAGPTLTITKAFPGNDVATSWINRKSGSHPEAASFEVGFGKEIEVKLSVTVKRGNQEPILIGVFPLKIDDSALRGIEQTQRDKLLEREKKVTAFVRKLGFELKDPNPGDATELAGQLFALTRLVLINQALVQAEQFKVKPDSIMISDDGATAALESGDILKQLAPFMGVEQKWPVVYAAIVKKYELASESFPKQKEFEADYQAWLKKQPVPK